MSFVYIYEQKTKIGFEENQFILLTPDEMQRSIPVECLEGVVLFGQIEVTSRVIKVQIFKDSESSFDVVKIKLFDWKLENSLLKEKFKIRRSICGVATGQARIERWKFLLSR